MATLTRYADLGNCPIEVYYDDSSLRLIGFAINNNTDMTAVFYLLSPIQRSLTVPKKSSSSLTIPVGQRPNWQFVEFTRWDGSKIMTIQGIEWRACFVV